MVEIGKDELAGRQIAVVDSGLNKEGANFEEREQAVIMYDEEGNVTVVQVRLSQPVFRLDSLFF